jgi:hypothetical protein
MAKKLNKRELQALEILMNWRNSQGERYLRMPYPERLMRLVDMGYVEQVANVLSGFDFRITQAGRAELTALDTAEAASATDGENETVANLRQALTEARNGDVHPIATLWDGVEEVALPDEQRYQAGDKDAEIARLKAALREIHTITRPHEMRGGLAEKIHGIADRALSGEAAPREQAGE